MKKMNDLTNENITTSGTNHKSGWKNRDAITILQEDVEMRAMDGPFIEEELQ
jgi:hypothetical protein